MLARGTAMAAYDFSGKRALVTGAGKGVSIFVGMCSGHMYHNYAKAGGGGVILPRILPP